MTQKDFEKLAYQLAKEEPPEFYSSNHNTWKDCVTAVMQACKDSNIKFNKDKFIAACSLEYWKTHKVP